MVRRRGRPQNRTATRRPDLRLVRDLEVLPDPEPEENLDPEVFVEALEEAGLPEDVAAALRPLADPDTTPETQVVAIATALLEDLGRCRRPLEVETTIGELLGFVAFQASQVSADGETLELTETADVQRALLDALSESFADRGSPAGLAGLRALAATGPTSCRTTAAAHADRLAATGLPEPRWSATIGHPAFVRAWRYGDVFGGQTSVGMLFDYGRREHALLTLIDHNLGGGVKDCFLVEGREAAELRPRTAEGLAAEAIAFFEDIGPDVAAAHLSAALAAGTCPVQDDQVEDVGRNLVLLWSRTALLARSAGLPEPVDPLAEVAPESVPGQILRVKVTLTGIRPPVWRRLELPTGLTLSRLHDVLQTAFGWTNSHLHSFELSPPAELRRQVRFARPEPLPEAGEPRTRIGQLLREPGDELVYRYDFGDDWKHRIVVEAISDPDAGQDYPRCTGGRRTTPPEDCGGAPGYAHLLAVLADRTHPEHRELSRWAPPGFDPAAFSRREVDDALAAFR